jgi:hypothetical protein
MHDVAGLTAELGRVHVGCAAIAGCRYNKEIEDCGGENDVQAAAEDAVVDVDLGKFGGDEACG